MSTPLRKLITVSMEAVDIVRSLPRLGDLS